jgi:hypothetical protein
MTLAFATGPLAGGDLASPRLHAERARVVAPAQEPA